MSVDASLTYLYTYTLLGFRMSEYVNLSYIGPTLYQYRVMRSSIVDMVCRMA